MGAIVAALAPFAPEPAVAATLVSLAVDFGSLEVFGSLQDAVEQATRR